MQHHFGIRGRLADGALRDELAAQRQAVGEIAVVARWRCRRPRARRTAAAHCEGWSRRWSSSARDPSPWTPGMRREGLRVGKVVADEAKLAFRVELPAIEADDACRFLTAMLQRMQAERGQRGGVGMPENAKHAALLVQRVAVQIEGVVHRIAQFPCTGSTVSKPIRTASRSRSTSMQPASLDRDQVLVAGAVSAGGVPSSPLSVPSSVVSARTSRHRCPCRAAAGW